MDLVVSSRDKTQHLRNEIILPTEQVQAANEAVRVVSPPLRKHGYEFEAGTRDRVVFSRRNRKLFSRASRQSVVLLLEPTDEGTRVTIEGQIPAEAHRAVIGALVTA